MKQSLSATLILLFLALMLILLVAAALNLYRQQGTLEETITAQATEQAYAQATVVKVVTEKRQLEETRDAVEAQQAAVAADLRVTIAAANAVIETLAAEDVALASAATRSVEITPQADTGDQLPVVKISLLDTQPIRRVGESIGIVVSASHPDGIIAINVEVNDEPFLSDSPNGSPLLHTVTTSWTPPGVGDYRITAVATNLFGRTSEPVALTFNIVEGDADGDITGDILTQIEANVIDLRGLEQLSPVTTRQLTPEELRTIVETDIAAERSDAELRDEVLVLSSFDFVPQDFDLREYRSAFLTAAIAGFYEEENDELFVVDLDNDGALNAEEQLTHAHEFMHALQDQHFSLALLDDGTLNKDAALALRALGEGEAELVETLYVQQGYLTGEEIDREGPITAEIEELPDFFVSDFSFPYIRGLEFVTTLFNQEDGSGGFEALNAAWDNLPASSEQIIHPEKYLAGEAPIPVTLPDFTGVLSGTRLIEENVLGEFYTQQYLGVWLETSEAVEAAAGWGGDRYQVLYNAEADATTLVLRFAWDSAAEKQEFEDIFNAYANVRMPEELGEQADGGFCWEGERDILCLYTTLDEVESLIVRGPDLATAAAVWTALTEDGG